jgi:hypothetical protein
MISNTEKLQCVERELKFRHRVFERMIEKGKMTKRQADREIELMTAIVEDYKKLAEVELLI